MFGGSRLTQETGSRGASRWWRGLWRALLASARLARARSPPQYSAQSPVVADVHRMAWRESMKSSWVSWKGHPKGPERVLWPGQARIHFRGWPPSRRPGGRTRGSLLENWATLRPPARLAFPWFSAMTPSLIRRTKWLTSGRFARHALADPTKRTSTHYISIGRKGRGCGLLSMLYESTEW